MRVSARLRRGQERGLYPQEDSGRLRYRRGNPLEKISLSIANRQAQPVAATPDLFEEANRQLTICNACRYCEGYCPVFRAIEIRRHFSDGDVLYLANLCHDCRACYYACMYTPPHKFAINIPQLLSGARTKSYGRWSWPKALARAFEQPSVGAWLGFCTAALVVASGLLLVAPDRMFAAHMGAGAFYRIIPYLAMVIPALALSFYAVGVWIRGGAKSQRETGESTSGWGGLSGFFGALAKGLALTYMKGGGPDAFILTPSLPERDACSIHSRFGDWSPPLSLPVWLFSTRILWVGSRPTR